MKASKADQTFPYLNFAIKFHISLGKYSYELQTPTDEENQCDVGQKQALPESSMALSPPPYQADFPLADCLRRTQFSHHFSI